MNTGFLVKYHNVGLLHITCDHQKSQNSLIGGVAVDNELFSEQVQVERKLFTLDLRENPRGRFLKVTEDVGGRRDTIIIPATGLEQVRELLDHAIAASKEAGPCEIDGNQ